MITRRGHPSASRAVAGVRLDDIVIVAPRRAVHLASRLGAPVAYRRSAARGARASRRVLPCAARNRLHHRSDVQCARRMPKELWGVYPADVNH
jgi:hypothetical protein